MLSSYCTLSTTSLLQLVQSSRGVAVGIQRGGRWRSLGFVLDWCSGVKWGGGIPVSLGHSLSSVLGECVRLVVTILFCVLTRDLRWTQGDYWTFSFLMALLIVASLFLRWREVLSKKGRNSFFCWWLVVIGPWYIVGWLQLVVFVGGEVSHW